MKPRLHVLAAVLWISGCALETKRLSDTPVEPEKPQAGMTMTLTPEQYQECMEGGGCVTFPWDALEKEIELRVKERGNECI